MDDQQALERYRSHPAHIPIVERMRVIAERIEVADIEV